MKNINFKNIIFFIFFAIFFTYVGYKNPEFVESSKKNIKFVLNKIGLINTIYISQDQLKEIKEEIKKKPQQELQIINGNSFDLKFERILQFDGRTAGLFLEKSKEKILYDIYLQNGVNIKNDIINELNLPLDISFKKNGGVKSVLKIDGKSFAFVSNKNLDCYYSSIFNLSASKKIFSTNCLPDSDRTDFNGLGGAYVEKENFIIFTLGSPEWNSQEIRDLAQKRNSNYGKILKFNKESFFKDKINQNDYEIYSLGHKNPQGLVLKNDKIFSVEHGPQGGDEINLILKNKNYGWPTVSFGTRYGDGKGYKKKDIDKQQPLFTFLPSIAPSSVNSCPSNLNQYYRDYTCLVLLSLRGMSTYVVLIDKKNLSVISIERFKIDQRLRHFALNKKNKLFQNENYFYISVDGDGIYKMKFDNFR